MDLVEGIKEVAQYRQETEGISYGRALWSALTVPGSAPSTVYDREPLLTAYQEVQASGRSRQDVLYGLREAVIDVPTDIPGQEGAFVGKTIYVERRELKHRLEDYQGRPDLKQGRQGVQNWILRCQAVKAFNEALKDQPTRRLKE